MIRLKVNMHPVDQGVRFVVGLSLIYVGFVDSRLIGDGFFSAVVGLFGILNVLSSTVRVCPVYWIAGFSTCPDSSASGNEQSALIRGIHRRLQWSFAAVSILLVALLGITGLRAMQHTRMETQEQSLVALAEVYQAKLRSRGVSCVRDAPARPTPPTNLFLPVDDATVVLLGADGMPYGTMPPQLNGRTSIVTALVAAAADARRGVDRVDGRDRLWAVSTPDAGSCRVLLFQDGVSLRELLTERPARWFAVAAFFFIWVSVWFSGGLARWIAMNLERENEKTLIQRAHRQRAEAESRMKSRFLASVSHEIRTPMNAIVGYAQLLSRETGLTPTQHKYVKAISHGSDHLVLLVNSVLDMSKLESGAVRLTISDVDLDRALDDVLRMFQLKAAEKKIFLNLSRSYPDGLRLRFDGLKVQQVLINLVGNALKFTSLGGVDIRASIEDKSPQSDQVRVVLEVKDTGSGLSPDDLRRVFEPFVQGASAAKGNAGTGLGLTVSRTMARLMGGDLTATSTLGRGSVFRFEFDAKRGDSDGRTASNRRVLGLAPRETPEGGETPRILVVDGEPSHVGVMGATLEAVGFAVRTVKSDEDVLAVVEDDRSELVLIDLSHRGEGGLELVRRIRELSDGGVKVVAVSTGTSPDLEARAHEAGAAALLHPPVAEATLFDTVRDLLTVQYRYAPIDESFIGAVDGEVLTRGRIPRSIVDALSSAVREGDVHSIGTQVDQVMEIDAEAGRRLAKLAHDFNYPALLHHLEAAAAGYVPEDGSGDAPHPQSAD